MMRLRDYGLTAKQIHSRIVLEYPRITLEQVKNWYDQNVDLVVELNRFAKPWGAEGERRTAYLASQERRGEKVIPLADLAESGSNRSRTRHTKVKRPRVIPLA